MTKVTLPLSTKKTYRLVDVEGYSAKHRDNAYLASVYNLTEGFKLNGLETSCGEVSGMVDNWEVMRESEIKYFEEDPIEGIPLVHGEFYWCEFNGHKSVHIYQEDQGFLYGSCFFSEGVVVLSQVERNY